MRNLYDRYWYRFYKKNRVYEIKTILLNNRLFIAPGPEDHVHVVYLPIRLDCRMNFICHLLMPGFWSERNVLKIRHSNRRTLSSLHGIRCKKIPADKKSPLRNLRLIWLDPPSPIGSEDNWQTVRMRTSTQYPLGSAADLSQNSSNGGITRPLLLSLSPSWFIMCQRTWF